MPAIEKGPPPDRDPARQPTDKQSPRGRSRYASSAPDGRLPRIFILAAAVILAGAAIMFWPRGGGEIPTGIGERITVVTADDSSITADKTPRSGDVEISQEQAQLVPEQPRATQPNQKPASDKTTEQSSGSARTKPATSGDRSAASPPSPTPARVVPSARGPWAVQVGAFGREDNAAALITKLTELGYPAKLRAASTSSGDIVYRVWIGYFATRTVAATYAEQNRAEIGDGNPVHR